MSITITKFSAEDATQLQYICKKTARGIFSKTENGRKMLCSVYNDYFTRFEPENIFVARDENQKAIGYIICSANYSQFKNKMLKTFLPEATRKSIFAPSVVLSYLVPLARLKKDEKTHLHIDILPEFQRQGIGTKLIDALRRHLFENGIETLSVCGISKSSSAFRFYVRYGFSVSKNHGLGAVSLSIKTDLKNG